MEYDKDGYPPEAMINYLARSWVEPRGDDELFTPRAAGARVRYAAFVQVRRPQWDPEEAELGQRPLSFRQMADTELAGRAAPRISQRGGDPAAADLPAVMALLKDRAETLEQLADGAMLFCGPFNGAPSGIGGPASDRAGTRRHCANSRGEAGGAEWSKKALSAARSALVLAGTRY